MSAAIQDATKSTVLSLLSRGILSLTPERRSTLDASVTKNLLSSNIKESMSIYTQMRLLTCEESTVAPKPSDKGPSSVSTGPATRATRRRVIRFIPEKIQ